jgi:hypothetical protein
MHCISFENKSKMSKISPCLVASFKERHENILKEKSKIYYNTSSDITEQAYVNAGSGF